MAKNIWNYGVVHFFITHSIFLNRIYSISQSCILHSSIGYIAYLGHAKIIEIFCKYFDVYLLVRYNFIIFAASFGKQTITIWL